MLNTLLDLALKEWSIVCDLLVQGRFALLLRKGGIHEHAGPGRFELEHRRFALFPAWEHQDPDRIKSAYRDDVEVFAHEPSEVTIRGYAEVPDGCIWQVASRAAFDSLEDLHPWTKPQIDMRFNYKPQRPLYLLALRVYRLAAPRTIPNRDRYAGCRSWLPLDEADAINDRGATPAMSDVGFTGIVQSVSRAMHSA